MATALTEPAFTYTDLDREEPFEVRVAVARGSTHAFVCVGGIYEVAIYFAPM